MTNDGLLKEITEEWIPLSTMESASAETYKYRIESAYKVQLPHSTLTPIPYVGEKEVVEYVTEELVALCPVTFLPDVYKVVVKFIPGEFIPELKSLKLSYMDYIKLPISHEHLASKLYAAFLEQIKPDSLRLELYTNIRGGIITNVFVGDKEL